ncbi:MAG: hypothetical protein JWL96_2045 [Sphingomonas bacterium]|nr:hypothetical protein [Sphingomonas bacterium]
MAKPASSMSLLDTLGRRDRISFSAANSSHHFSATAGSARCHSSAVSVQLASARPKCTPSAQRSNTGGKVNSLREKISATSGGVMTSAIAAAAVQAGMCSARRPR